MTNMVFMVKVYLSRIRQCEIIFVRYVIEAWIRPRCSSSVAFVIFVVEAGGGGPTFLQEIINIIVLFLKVGGGVWCFSASLKTYTFATKDSLLMKPSELPLHKLTEM